MKQPGASPVERFQTKLNKLKTDVYNFENALGDLDIRASRRDMLELFALRELGKEGNPSEAVTDEQVRNRMQKIMSSKFGEDDFLYQYVVEHSLSEEKIELAAETIKGNDPNMRENLQKAFGFRVKEDTFNMEGPAKT